MKKILFGLSTLAVIFVTAYFLFFNEKENNSLTIIDQGFVINKYNTPAGKVANEVNWTRPKKNNKDESGIKFAAKYLSKLRANPDGVYNPMDYYRARIALNNQRNSSAKSASLGLEWESLGPDNIAGRNRGFLIDNTNPNKLYTGSVTGGMFVSEDLGESWYPHPQTEEWDFLGISSIQQSSNGDIYFGTGEYFVYTEGNGSGHLGGGIYKSTDGGETFSVLPSTLPDPNNNNDPWSYVTEIAIDPNSPNRIYATTASGFRNNQSGVPGTGLQISSDGGQTWSAPGNLTNNREAQDVKVNSDGVVFLCYDRKYYRSLDGDNFDLQSGVGGFPATGTARIEFAVAPQDPNYVYALISNNNRALYGIYKSTDAGLSWDAISPQNSETFNPLGFQGDYDMCIAVSPFDKDRVFVGGQLEFYAGQSGGWNLIATSYRSSVSSPYYIHADMHGIHPHPNNPDLIYILSDGGTFKTANASAQFPTFKDANKLCHTTQYYTIQADDLGRSIGGLQDNGMQLIDGQGNSGDFSNDLAGFGDGGYGAISSVNRDAMFGESQEGALKRSSNGGESFGGFFDEKVDAINNDSNNPPGDGLPDAGTEFIAAGLLWEDNPKDDTTEINNPSTPWVDTFEVVSNKKSIYFIGANGRLFFTPEAIEFNIQPRWFDIRVAGGFVTAIESTPDGIIFAGTSGGNLYKIEGLADKYKYDTVYVERLTQVTVNGVDSTVSVVDKTIRLVPDYPADNINDWIWNSTTLDSYQGVTRTSIGAGLPSRYVSGIGVDPNFASTGQIVVTYPGYDWSSYVYRSSGSTTNFSFSNITNDLVLAPVYDALIDANNSDNILLATDLGVFASDNAGANWTEQNSGLNRSPVFKLFQNKLYEDGCNVIYAGSYGRGAFRTTTLTPTGCDITPYKGLNTSVEEPVKVTEKSPELNIYPNPAVNYIVMEIDNNKFENNAVISLIDITGKVMIQERVNTNNKLKIKHQLDVSALSSGYYILSISDGKQALSDKFMIAK